MPATPTGNHWGGTAGGSLDQLQLSLTREPVVNQTLADVVSSIHGGDVLARWKAGPPLDATAALANILSVLTTRRDKAITRVCTAAADHLDELALELHAIALVSAPDAAKGMAAAMR